MRNAEFQTSVFLENLTTKTFALLEYMEQQGYHQIPFENCKVAESQNYVEKLNFGLNISFTPINTRLNLLVSNSNLVNSETSTNSTGESSSGSDTATSQTGSNSTANSDSATDNSANSPDTAAALQRILEAQQSKTNPRPGRKILGRGKHAHE